ncbi:MAG: exonuclease domain-containing protein [Chloroflexi bacterium]|nr:exonuclease domain-containing protein [Chloroflexota bacterium]MDA1010430.1 exonuclease domain-containing protein [Chloroflexota bacterium]
MLNEFVAVDLETTGLNVETDLIIEVGATRFDRDGHAEAYRTFVDPGRAIPIEVQDLTGITPADLVGAPRFTDVRSAVIEFIGDRAVVGQNVGFDLGFLQAERVVPPGPAFDTWELASILLPTADRLNLSAIAELLDVTMPVAHRALADAEATRDIFLALLARLEMLPRALLVELRSFAERAGWGVSALLDDALERAGHGTVDPAEAAEIAASLTVRASRTPAAPLVPRDVRVPVRAEDVAGVFALGGSRTDLYPAYEARTGQVQMGQAVAAHLDHGGYLAVEAGTGTGKSMAYLVPAMVHAVRNDDRVVVSTHTLNLQDQLSQRDAPQSAVLVEAYLREQGETGGVRTSVLKGRGNYLCLERWAEVRRDPSPRTEAEVRLFSRVAAWLPQTQTGDLAELYMTSQERPAWSQIAAEDTDCLQRRCPYVRDGSCFLLRARQEAAAAHVVIVNHSLLLANAAQDDQVLPPFRHLVVDEAHRLEDVATQHFTATLGVKELRDLVESAGIAGKQGQPGFAARLQGTSGGDAVLALSPAAGLAPLAASMEVAVSGIHDHVRDLGEALRRFIEEALEDGGSRRDISLTPARRGQASWEEVETVAVSIDIGLQVLSDRLGQVRDALAALEPETAWQAELRQEAGRMRDAFAEARVILRSVVLHADREDIAWVARSDGDIRIGRAPLEVARNLEAAIYRGRESVLATSATLSAGGSFDFTLRRLGMDEADTLIVESPYDYRTAVLALLAEELPDPGMPSYETALQQTIAEVVRASAGRTLVLFTSHQAVRSTSVALRGLLSEDEINVFAQGIDGSPQRLLRMLNERPRSVVLGTAAFWEGVDVPGEALSQIVIARLPFPVPTDPIYEGRSEEFDDPFGEYALPQAVLRFRQGFGRLIRGQTDRGTFVVLDSRIVRRSYGRTFLEGLPDCEVRTLRAAEIAGHVERWLA